MFELRIVPVDEYVNIVKNNGLLNSNIDEKVLLDVFNNALKVESAHQTLKDNSDLIAMSLDTLLSPKVETSIVKANQFNDLMPYYFVEVKTEKTLYYLNGNGVFQDLTFLDALDVDALSCKVLNLELADDDDVQRFKDCESALIDDIDVIETIHWSDLLEDYQCHLASELLNQIHKANVVTA